MSSLLSAPSPASSLASPPEETRRAYALAPKAEERDWSQPSKTSTDQSLSFSDFLSAINPLQHIPIIGSIYRAVTGDTISPVSRVVGGALFGGPVGLIVSAFNAAIEQVKGKDLGDQALALLTPDKGMPAPAEPPPQFADASSSAPAPERVIDEAAIAPVSRNLLGAVPTRTATAAPGNDRTLTGSLYGPPASGTAPASQGRTLADYRNFTGRPLPTIDTTRSGGTHSNPVRLQPTAPMAERPRTSVNSVAKEDAPAPSTPTDTGASAGDSPTAVAPANEPFVAAMARGLDRYREQRRIGAGSMQIDTTL